MHISKHMYCRKGKDFVELIIWTLGEILQVLFINEYVHNRHDMKNLFLCPN